MEAEDNIQKMYKYFGILADAKDNIAEVSSIIPWRDGLANVNLVSSIVVSSGTDLWPICDNKCFN